MNDDSDNIVFENQRFLSVRFFGTDISLERVESICSVLDCGVWTIFWNLYWKITEEKTMVDTKKEQERDELHRAIWAIADELRGAVDGWDFKNYVLGTMFYRYISENLCNYINNGEIDAGNTDFDFSKMADEDAEEARDSLVEEKGFFILPSELFCNVRANAANDENLMKRWSVCFATLRNLRRAVRPKAILPDCSMIMMSTAIN